MKLGCRSFETADAFRTVSATATAFRTENHLARYPPLTSAGALYVPREVPATHLRAPRGRSAAPSIVESYKPGRTKVTAEFGM